MPFTSDNAYRVPSIADLGILQHINKTAIEYTHNRGCGILLGSALFSALIENDVSIAAIGRVWGLSRNTIREWMRHYYNEGLGTKAWRKRYKSLTK